MRNNGENNTLGSIFMVSVGVIFGFSFFLSFSTERYRLIGLVLPFIAVLVFSVCLAIRKAYRQRIREYLKQVLKNVRKIAAGEDFEAPGESFFHEEISELYRIIDQLNKSLVAQNISKDNLINIINSIAFNIELDELFDDMLPKIIDGTKSNWGAFYLFNKQTEKMELKSSFGFTKNIYKEFDIALGDGFIGKSALSDKINVFKDIPDDTIYISKTFLGKIKPRSIMTVPIRTKGEIVAVLLLASINDYSEDQIEIVDLIRYYMASAVTNGLTYQRTKRLKNELTFQNRLIQDMNEELESKVELRTMLWSNIINSIVDYAIIAMDKDGYVIVWNKGAEAISGLEEKDVVGKHISETYIDSESGKSLEWLKIARRDGKCEDNEWLIQSPGSAKYVHRIITAIYNDAEEFTGYTAIVRDMTSYKILEDQAAYSSYLYNLLLAGDEKTMVVANEAGLIMNLSDKAAALFGRSADELCGYHFGNLIENREIFIEKLNSCIREQTSESWKDKLASGANGETLSLSMASIAAPGSSEKIVVIYINKQD